MLIPDANLLIYAHDSSSPDHGAAKKWWEAVLSGDEPVGLPWVVLLAFARIMTHPQICTNPRDFDRFPGIRRVNPLSGNGGKSALRRKD